MALDYISMRVPVAEAEDDLVIGRGATADGCQRGAQEYLCHCLKVFRKYSYLSVMYRLSYTQVAGKTAQRYDKISGYIITSPPLQGAKAGKAGEDKNNQ